LEEFIVFRHPNETQIHVYTGVWEEMEFNGTCNGFWAQPFDRTALPIVLKEEHLPDWKELAFTTKPYPIEAIENSQKDFESYIRAILDKIEHENLQKVVPARTSFFEKERLNAKEVFLKSLNSNPNAFCYYLQSSKYGCWTGASPETFFNYANGIGDTMALAGTRTTNVSDNFSAKEFEEQGIVLEYVKKLMGFHGSKVQSTEPVSIQAAHLSHLVSKITASIPKSEVPNLIRNLHPTPAVGGFPLIESLEIINENETFSRSLYAGWLGHMQHEKFRSYVNLRCASLYDNGMLCYAGCGVNRGSVPKLEFLETENKMQVMARLLD